MTGDTLGHEDVFVRDRLTGTTERVSVSSSGAEGDGDSFGLGDLGRRALRRPSRPRPANLVTGDTLGFRDVFVHDRKTGKTRRVSVSSAGTEANGDSFSAAHLGRRTPRWLRLGRPTNLVAADTKGFTDAFVRDQCGGHHGPCQRPLERSRGGWGQRPSGPSGDGRFVAFASTATNLVNADSNSERDVFWRGPL